MVAECNCRGSFWMNKTKRKKKMKTNAKLKLNAIRKRKKIKKIETCGTTPTPSLLHIWCWQHRHFCWGFEKLESIFSDKATFSWRTSGQEKRNFKRFFFTRFRYIFCLCISCIRPLRLPPTHSVKVFHWFFFCILLVICDFRWVCFPYDSKFQIQLSLLLSSFQPKAHAFV